MMNKPQKVVILILFFCSTLVSAQTTTSHTGLASLSSIEVDTVATGLIRAGHYRAAIALLEQDSTPLDKATSSFKLGLAFFKCREYSQALFHLRLAAGRSAIITPLAYELIGDVEQAQHRPENALNAYRAALSPSLPEAYNTVLQKKMVSVLAQNRATLGPLIWLGETAQTPVLSAPFLSLLDSLFIAGATAEINRLIEQCADSLDNTTLTIANACTLYTVIQKYKPAESALSTGAWFFIAKAARLCRASAFADSALEIVEKRADRLKRIPEVALYYQRAMTAYSLQKYDRALTWFDRYCARGGVLTPDIVITIARTHRNRNNGDDAYRWYEKHTRLFPNDRTTPEIFWYMAWEKEGIGDYASALRLYEIIFTKYKRSLRADDALLRSGLCCVKEGKYTDALQWFGRYQARFGDSDMVNAARFWSGKCYSELHLIDSAKNAFKSVCRRTPYDYYAFRSRQLLNILGDSTVLQCDTQSPRTWLDTVYGAARGLTDSNRATAVRGVLLGRLGLTRSADLFFSTLAQSGSDRIWLWQELIAFYEQSRDSLLAFRAARRLIRAIPPAARSATPLQLYQQAWPRCYQPAIEYYARRNRLDPELVYGLIRQESLFDSGAVSGVGAQGLMQIMPYTGKAIAVNLKEPFTPDSLLRPEYNIRFGCSYIRELLDQFSGNAVLAIASYNGGPVNAQKWYERNKDKSSDLFMEDIVFSETREYVKKVLANYWMYKTIYY